MTDVSSLQILISESIQSAIDVEAMSQLIINQLKQVGCKTTLRLVERAIFTAGMQDLRSREEEKVAQLSALSEILQDFTGDEALAFRICSV